MAFADEVEPKGSVALWSEGPLQCGAPGSRERPQDASRISLSENDEIRYWTERFGMSLDELHRAVMKVGNSVQAIEREIAGRAREI